MDWLTHGKQWPNNEASRFVSTPQGRFHIQQMGQGPSLVLLHGTGATTHSYAHLMPLLAQHYTVTALDLPGHGFTSPLAGSRPTIERVSAAIRGVLTQEGIAPSLIVGHSAGAAIAVHMVAAQGLAADGVVSINGAFYPFPGVAASLFPMAARALFLNPFVPSIVSMGAGNRRRVERLLASTGSTLDAEALGYYHTALKSARHVDGALALMANWDLTPVPRLLAALDVPMLQIIGAKDGTIQPSDATKTARVLRHGSLETFAGRGHLVHEEVPKEVAARILTFGNSLKTNASSP